MWKSIVYIAFARRASYTKWLDDRDHNSRYWFFTYFNQQQLPSQWKIYHVRNDDFATKVLSSVLNTKIKIGKSENRPLSQNVHTFIIALDIQRLFTHKFVIWIDKAAQRLNFN